MTKLILELRKEEETASNRLTRHQANPDEGIANHMRLPKKIFHEDQLRELIRNRDKRPLLDHLFALAVHCKG
jgi:hypothetical protein